jgi:hypothetical protein
VGEIAQGAPSVAAAPTWARFDRLAANLFLVLAVLGGIVVLLVVSTGWSATIDPPWLADMVGRPVLLVLVLGTLLVDIVLLYGMSAGLDRGAAWARPAAINVLIVMTVLGVVQVIVELGAGKLTIPLGALLGGWVLSTRPGPAPRVRGRPGRIALAITLASIITLLPSVVPWWAGS